MLVFTFNDCCEDNNFSLSYSFLKMALTDLREFLFTAMGSSMFLIASNIFFAFVTNDYMLIDDINVVGIFDVVVNYSFLLSNDGF